MRAKPGKPVVLRAIAQTNLALYKQLHDAGYDAGGLTRIRDCYEFATTLFAGHYRASGKPFLAHLTGTASILAALGAGPATVAAGLLHAAYEQGDLSEIRWRDRRRRVARAIGPEAEAIVWRYQQMGWEIVTIQRVHGGLAELSELDRTIVLIRLANELDDNLDLAMRYSHQDKDANRGIGEVIVSIANALHYPQLAAALAEARREAADGSWASALSLDRRRSYQLTRPFALRLRKAVRAVIAAM
jgi:(p)ppGpp synthase/HD superfamily hydrolase